jgi:hypothetical protein
MNPSFRLEQDPDLPLCIEERSLQRNKQDFIPHPDRQAFTKRCMQARAFHLIAAMRAVSRGVVNPQVLPT